MNLCIVANGNFFSTYGGGQVYVKNLVDELIRQKDELGITLSIISFSHSFELTPQQKDYHGVNLYEVNAKGDIAKLLSTLKPDIVHAHGEKAKVVKCCHDLDIKCVITAHHGGICCPAGSLLNHKDEICHEPANLQRCLPCYLRNIRTGKYWYPIAKHIPNKLYLQIGKGLKKLPFIPFLSPIGEAMLSVQEKLEQWSTIHTLATHIIAPSYAISDSMVLNGCDKNKITVIPHGIPLPALAPNPIPLTSNLSPLTFYYVGRICYVKGIHVMLKAFSMIDNPNVQLHLIGGAGNKTEEHYMNDLVKRYRKDHRIVWHGKVPPNQVKSYTKDYHCLVHPTICLEIFGLNISESLSQGHWVIATQCGGAEMQITDGANGNLIAPNNVQALTQALLSYFDRPKIPIISNTNSIQQNASDIFSVYRSIQKQQSSTCSSL